VSHILKVDGWDLGIAAGPATAYNIQFTGVMPGGHAACSFDVYCANAYLAPHHALRVGNWIELYDDAHELWEGGVVSVKPVVSIGGQHMWKVQGAGLLNIAAKRGDLSKTWVRRGGAAWLIHPDANRSGEYVVGSDGVLSMLVRAGAAQVFTTPMRMWYVIDGLLSDDYISHVAWTAEWDTLNDASSTWTWSLTCDAVALTEANSSSTGTADTHTPAASTKWVGVTLTGGGTPPPATDHYVRFTEMDVYGSSKTAKVRVDQAMVDVATRTGLATSSVSSAVGQTRHDLHFERMSAGSMLGSLAKLHDAPFDWGFWNNRTFYARPLERRPSNPNRVVTVGGGNPGLVSWDVDDNAEDVPEFVCVYFGNSDDPDYPEGWVRRLYVPYAPDDTADVRMQTLDFSGLILSDAAATAAGANLLQGTGTYDIPPTPVWAVHPEFADGGMSAGNNADPTSSYSQLYPGQPAGTVTNCAWTTASGWDGDNIATDPTCLVLDGTNDFVTWGDLDAVDFGTGAFSACVWFKLNVVDAAQTLLCKYDAANYIGYELIVTSTNQCAGYVGLGSVAKYDMAIHDAVLTTGVWYFAAVTYTGTTDRTLTLYLNAVSDDLFNLSTGLSPSSPANTVDLKLGAAS